MNEILKGIRAGVRGDVTQTEQEEMRKVVDSDKIDGVKQRWHMIADAAQNEISIQEPTEVSDRLIRNAIKNAASSEIVEVISESPHISLTRSRRSLFRPLSQLALQALPTITEIFADATTEESLPIISTDDLFALNNAASETLLEVEETV